MPNKKIKFYGANSLKCAATLRYSHRYVIISINPNRRKTDTLQGNCAAWAA